MDNGTPALAMSNAKGSGRNLRETWSGDVRVIDFFALGRGFRP